MSKRNERMRRARAGTGLALLLAGTATQAMASASSTPPTTQVDSGTIDLRCGSAWDAAESRRRGPVAIQVREGRIVAVTPDDAPLRPGETDLRTSTCLPGLIDAHTHVMLESDRLEGDYDRQLLRETPEYRTIVATRHARRMIGWGFTTIRDLGSEGASNGDLAVRDAIAGGLVPGPRMQVATQAIAATGAYPLLGYAPGVEMPSGVEQISGADAGRAAVRRQIAHGADVVKLYADRSPRKGPDGSILTISTLTLDELRAMTDEAHRQQRKVAIHARAAESAANAIAAGADSIDHGDYLSDENLRAMARAGVAYVPDFDTDPRVAQVRVNAGYPIWSYIPEVKCRTLARAMRAGVTIAFGSGIGGADWTYNAAGAFRPMAACGMSPEQILTAATRSAAALMNMADRVGTLEPGKLADIIAVEGDPLADVAALENVVFVSKGGVVVKAAQAPAASE